MYEIIPSHLSADSTSISSAALHYQNKTAHFHLFCARQPANEAKKTHFYEMNASHKLYSNADDVKTAGE